MMLYSNETPFMTMAISAWLLYIISWVVEAVLRLKRNISDTDFKALGYVRLFKIFFLVGIALCICLNSGNVTLYMISTFLMFFCMEFIISRINRRKMAREYRRPLTAMETDRDIRNVLLLKNALDCGKVPCSDFLCKDPVYEQFSKAVEMLREGLPCLQRREYAQLYDMAISELCYQCGQLLDEMYHIDTQTASVYFGRVTQSIESVSEYVKSCLSCYAGDEKYQNTFHCFSSSDYH